MPERDKDVTSTTDQLARELMERIKSAEFGSTVYQAASDFFDLNNLQSTLEIVQNHADNSKEPKSSRYWKSKERITEMRVALLEHEISQREVQVEGYSNVYYRLITLDDDLEGDSNKNFFSAAEHAVDQIRASGHTSP
jgi:hypothetical protein